MTDTVCVRGDKPPTQREQEIIDRFADFLALRAAIKRRVDDGTYIEGQALPPWQRYALRMSAWRMTHFAEER